MSLEVSGQPGACVESFDVYLSYNEVNMPEVDLLYRALKAQGIKPWFDKQEIRPGFCKLTEMEKGLKQSKTIVVLLGSEEIGAWQGEQIQAGLIMAVGVQGKKLIIPVKLPSCSFDEESISFLANRGLVSLLPRLDEYNFKVLLWGITGEKPEVILLNSSVVNILSAYSGVIDKGLMQPDIPQNGIYLSEMEYVISLKISKVCLLLQQQQFSELNTMVSRMILQQDYPSLLLPAFQELVRQLEAAQRSSAASIAEKKLLIAEGCLHNIETLYVDSTEPFAIYFPVVLRAAAESVTAMRRSNAAATTSWLLNPFIAGNPLSGTQRWGQQLFRGRERQIRQVERLLADAHSANSFALLGPRRCGKSTLLNMLRRQLPDTQLVLFDLQGNPADSPLAFYRALVRQAQRQAEEDRRLQLPDLPEGAPIEALAAWLDLLENDQRVTRFLICIDEFERLPDLFPASVDGTAQRDLLQFLGLLRATVQHRQRVRLLVAGAAPFDELETLWTDHLINLQEIQVGFLDAASAEGLLTQPCPEMPADAIPAALARAMVARTAGQPYLTQLYGQILIDQLNDAERRQACLDDLEPVEREALSKAVNYFQNIWRALRPDAAQALLTLAQGQPLALPSATRRYLQRRLLIGEDDRLSIPVFQRWLLEFQLDAAG